MTQQELEVAKEAQFQEWLEADREATRKAAFANMRCCLYWMFDETCYSELYTGYVGVSEKPLTRWNLLRCEERFPPNVRQLVLCEGTREECLNWENELRPDKNIGWNKKRGGGGQYNNCIPPYQPDANAVIMLADIQRQYDMKYSDRLWRQEEEEYRRHPLKDFI